MSEITSYKEALQHPIFEVVSKASEQLNSKSYAIGGFVSDFILKRDFKKSIDILAVGSGIELALKATELLPNKPN